MKRRGKIRFEGDYTQEEVTKRMLKEMARLKKLGYYSRTHEKYMEDGIFKNNISDKDWKSNQITK